MIKFLPPECSFFESTFDRDFTEFNRELGFE